MQSSELRLSKWALANTGSAWGRVMEVTDQHLVVEQTLTDDQKRHMREQGALPYDSLEIHVPREDPRHLRGYMLPPVTR